MRKILTVANYLSDTKEFIGISDAYNDEIEELSFFCTDIMPPKEKKGYARVFNETLNRWEYLVDFRGEVVFNIKTHERIKIIKLGNKPVDTTDSQPKSNFDVWDGSQWVKDDSKEKAFFTSQAEAKKTYYLSLATRKIAPLQDAVDLDIATDDELAQLKEWKKYRVLVNRIDTSTAPDIEYPEMPE